jgi:hypothetical protein
MIPHSPQRGDWRIVLELFEQRFSMCCFKAFLAFMPRILLRQVNQLSDAVERLAEDCSISPRQAYRYLEYAQQLKGPVPPGEAKLAFTVKLPHSLVRAYATTKRLSISEVVSRALLALLPRGRGRG